MENRKYMPDLEEIEKRLKAELQDPKLPFHRKREVETCLAYLIRERRMRKGWFSPPFEGGEIKW